MQNNGAKFFGPPCMYNRHNVDSLPA